MHPHPASSARPEAGLLQVAEAVAFGAPDEKFGEVVAAAVVPSGDIGDENAFIKDLRSHAGSKLAKFKVSHILRAISD